MYKTNHLSLSFRNEGFVKGALKIVITANIKDISGYDVVDKYRIICWKKYGKTYFNLDIVLTSLEFPHSQLFLSKEEVIFDDENRINYFTRDSDSVRYQRLPSWLKEYLRENLFYIIKEAHEETVAK